MKITLLLVVLAAVSAIQMRIAIRRRSVLLGIVAIFPLLVPLDICVTEAVLHVSLPLWFRLLLWASAGGAWFAALRLQASEVVPFSESPEGVSSWGAANDTSLKSQRLAYRAAKTKKLLSTLSGTVFLAVLILLVSALIYGAVARHQREYSHETYAAWCKLHRRSDFTFEEWKSMRLAGLLDGRSTLIIPIYSGR